VLFFVESLPLDLAGLLTSWLRELRGERKSRHTVSSYEAAVRSFLAFCAEQQIAPELSKSNVIGWLGAQGTNMTSTVRLRLTAIKLFARWLADAEGLDADAVLAVKPPKSDSPSVPDLSENEVRRMLKACDGTSLRDRRDKAMLVLLAETGLRAAELLALDVTDVDLDGCVAHVRRGKGGKGRRVRFSVSAAATLDRYVRARHRAISHPAQGPLWISNRGARLSYTGLVATLKGRAKDAGVVGFHVHRLRHSAAVRWLRSGGTETGLMAQAGWTTNSMVGRYVKAASEQLAGEEFDRLDLGIKEL